MGNTSCVSLGWLELSCLSFELKYLGDIKFPISRFLEELRTLTCLRGLELLLDKEIFVPLSNESRILEDSFELLVVVFLGFKTL